MTAEQQIGISEASGLEKGSSAVEPTMVHPSDDLLDMLSLCLMLPGISCLDMTLHKNL